MDWKGSEYQLGDEYRVTEEHIFVAQWEKEALKPIPVTPEKSNTNAPKTGDTNNLLLWLTILSAAMLGLFRVINLRRRNGFGN